MHIFLKKHIRLVICVICILCIFGGKCYISNLTDNISMQFPGERWSDDGSDNGYVAAFFEQDSGLTLEDISQFEGTYREILKEDGFEQVPGKKVYNDAYSCDGRLEIAKKTGENVTSVNVTAVGGEYFFFHPMSILSGSYIYSDDLMHDRVVIDENTAWSLYGSADIAGKTCVINNKYYYIAGVIKHDESKIKDKTYGNRSRIYMHFDEYLKINQDATVTSYEIVYPETITGRTKSVMEKLLGNEEGAGQVEGIIEEDYPYEIVDMDRRYGALALWDNVRNFAGRMIRTKAIAYPYWENECRMTECYADIAFIWIIVWSLILTILLIPIAIKLYKNVVSGAEKLSKKIIQKISNI